MIESVEYMANEDKITAYIVVSQTTTAEACLNSKIYAETSNKTEPFDYNLHKFEFNKDELIASGEFTIKLKAKSYWPDKPAQPIEQSSYTIKIDNTKVISEEEAVYRSVRNLKLEKTEADGNLPGVQWTRELYITNDSKPVRVYTSVIDLNKCQMISGTPNSEPIFTPNVVQTVLEEAQAVEAANKTVLCATNADFFDIFGDCHPSGLCISQGITVTNPQTEHGFFGILKNGLPIITNPDKTDIKDIKEAVSGREIIVKDSKIAETDPLQPFGETKHPRTAVGITEDNKVIQMVVDGNNPTWSNGASLTELALLMIEKGAKTALNLDGGGSSTFVVRENNSLSMINKPNGRIIISKTGRQVFNSLITISKKQ